ncbi:MAG: HEAT repeat domain-containing protein [Thermosynechococcaceae cyanobacterium]
MNSPEQTIALLQKILLTDSDSSVRIVVIQSLAILGRYHPLDITPINKAASGDPDPNVRIAAIKALTELNIPSTAISKPSTVQMTFNAPVYGAAGNIEGNQIINASDQIFDALFNDYKQFFSDLQQKYPAQTPEAALQPILNAEFQEIQKTQPQRWQNFLNLKRLWNGSKKATFKMGEHFTEENLWGKMAIAFLEGVAEDAE